MSLETTKENYPHLEQSNNHSENCDYCVFKRNSFLCITKKCDFGRKKYEGLKKLIEKQHKEVSE